MFMAVMFVCQLFLFNNNSMSEFTKMTVVPVVYLVAAELLKMGASMPNEIAILAGEAPLEEFYHMVEIMLK